MDNRILRFNDLMEVFKVENELGKKLSKLTVNI